MKFLIAVVAIGGVIGWTAMSMFFASGTGHQTVAKYTGFSRVCVDHVTYLQFTSGAAVQVDPTGKPVPCE